MFQSQVVVLIAALFVLQMAIVCAVLRRSAGMERSGLTSWAIGDLVVTVAAVLLAVHGYRPEWPLAALPELALTAGLSMMVHGTRHFVGKPGRAMVLTVLNVPGAIVLALHAVGGLMGAAPSPLSPGVLVSPSVVAGLMLASSLIQMLLLLEIIRVVVPRLPAKRGTGRLAILSLTLVALACTVFAGAQAWAPLSALVDGHPLATPDERDNITLCFVFGVVGLSVSFALMAHDRLRRIIERRARHDDLTDVLSRGAFWEELELACKQAERQRTAFTVAFIDLDHFKAINDLYGHLAGDSVLRHFAGLLRKAAPARAVLGRLGGEEFAIVMPDTTLETGRAISVRLSAMVRSAPCPSEPDAIAYTVSIGMAERQAGENADAVMRRADRALYDAKQMGRNCVSSHDTAEGVGMPRRPRVRERESS
ncbi:diguanylate cyclase (GGDEF) domain-containing protein [Ralstonia sp. 25mfcol4.1]|uniref:GGDEF domain-containing protein n=1 Tax=Burkholderiaceae TaxID=119060 RepID=UPI0008808CAB|nr:GGDEF domain-containing protein [Ralstonia sp. 25mfcol4.1]SDO61010.1 diguanylate cyclase (GGDEF) domain-containing protein [Ralstonia sp. 25mfcol4.1]